MRVSVLLAYGGHGVWGIILLVFGMYLTHLAESREMPQSHHSFFQQIVTEHRQGARLCAMHSLKRCSRFVCMSRYRVCSHSFTHLYSAYYMPGTVLGVGG